MRTLAKYGLFTAALVGLAMVAMGAMFMAKGFDAKADIEAALLKERVLLPRILSYRE